MAAATIIHLPVPRQSPTPPLDTPKLSLETFQRGSTPIPNKHLPYCPPGPPASDHNAPSTPPVTPPSKDATLNRNIILHPAVPFPKALDSHSVFSIDASTLATALQEIASKPLPDAKHVFPWLHGLHGQNQMQLAFFDTRRSPPCGPPKCFREITIVKAGGDLSCNRLKGAVSPDEVLDGGTTRDAAFLEVDPREGFSVRNFQIQVAKMAVVSDIVVYRDNSTPHEDVQELAKKIATAQSSWRAKNSFVDDEHAPSYGTFILSEPFEQVEKSHPHLVVTGSDGETRDFALDFALMERREMSAMSKASEISHNVWLGPTPNSSFRPPYGDEPTSFDILIEASDLATPPDARSLRRIGEESYATPQAMEFPSSGSVIPQSCPKTGIDPLTRTCRWIRKLANQDSCTTSEEDDFAADSDGDILMRNLHPTSRKILIHCTDGYTETTLLALAYFMHAEQVPVHEAWLRLHCEKKRNFFAYSSDVTLLSSLEHRLVQKNYPRVRQSCKNPAPESPAWLSRMDGSLPSRILPYLYLGNLGHANNPELLKAIGISQILSIGEPINWTTSQIECWGTKNLENVMYVDRVQDNGVDPLMPEFYRCLNFIEKGKLNQTATLVHCRVGVSRSATICIAEVMKSLGMSFPRAYCFVRARRLNVIIQPHLRFAYELMKWDEICQQRRGQPIDRDVEWASLCREIAGMNRPYCCR